MYFQKQPLEVLYCKKVFLEILQNLQENNFARVSFLIKLQASACNFIKKKPLAQLFSREFYEISKNTFSYRTPPVAASVFRPFYNYSNLGPSLQNKRNSSQQSKSSWEFSLFRLQTLIKLSFFYNI